MIVELSSPFLKIKINSFGAEICSIKNTEGVEFIWQADKNVWARHAPVLFPIVGKLKNNTFTHLEKNYDLPQHGFARDMEFELALSNKKSCTFQLLSSAETKKKFPFDFIFEINYSLDKSVLTTTYSVKNNSQQELLFSVGAHPGFNCPLLPNENFKDYFLEFESEDLNITKLNNGLRTAEKIKLVLDGKRLQLSSTLFDNDALVIENSQINSISLCSNKSAHKIKMDCKGWPYFGIWSKKGNTQFVCLEPWYGIADSDSSSGQLNKKDGIIVLDSSQEFSCSFSTSFD